MPSSWHQSQYLLSRSRHLGSTRQKMLGSGFPHHLLHLGRIQCINSLFCIVYRHWIDIVETAGAINTYGCAVLVDDNNGCFCFFLFGEFPVPSQKRKMLRAGDLVSRADCTGIRYFARCVGGPHDERVLWRRLWLRISTTHNLSSNENQLNVHSSKINPPH